MKVAVFEPFYAGSHKQWLDGFVRFTQHEVKVFTLPGRYWKWRMHGAAVTLAKEFISSGFDPDVIIATDMLDLTVLLSLGGRRLSDKPVALYMHENQLTYPWSDGDPDTQLQRDNHYAFINFTSALAADTVLFNSPYHMSSFLEALPLFLKQFPDFRNLNSIDEIKGKSMVLPVGVDLAGLGGTSRETKHSSPVILWNHRWEYDKNPHAFFRLIDRLASDNYDFELVICGERSRDSPEIFEVAIETHRDRVRHVGFAPDRLSYASLLRSADILPVTSRQEFFGISVVEAMYCGVMPVLPNRLTYPWLLGGRSTGHLYDSEDALYGIVSDTLDSRNFISCKDAVAVYDWRQLISSYDQMISQMPVG